VNNIKKKYIAYIIIATVIIYGIVRYFNTVEGYIGNITKAGKLISSWGALILLILVHPPD